MAKAAAKAAADKTKKATKASKAKKATKAMKAKKDTLTLITDVRLTERRSARL